MGVEQRVYSACMVLILRECVTVYQARHAVTMHVDTALNTLYVSLIDCDISSTQMGLPLLRNSHIW